MEKRDEFFRRLLATFKVEAQEHRSVIASGLLRLETATPDEKSGLLETIFRAAHSLKGAARAVNYPELESACHILENIFSQWKQFGAPEAAGSYDVLNRVMDILARLIANSGSPNKTSAPDNPSTLLGQIDFLINHALVSPSLIQDGGSAAKGEALPLTSPPPVAPSAPQISSFSPIPELGNNPLVIREETGTPKTDPESRIEISSGMKENTQVPEKIEEKREPWEGKSQTLETIRVSTRKLDQLLLQTEELLTTKQASIHLVKKLIELKNRCLAWKKNWSRVQHLLRMARKNSEKASKGDSSSIIEPLLEFLEFNQQSLDLLSIDLNSIMQGGLHHSHSSSLLIDSLIEDMKKVLMRPFDSILDGIPRLARDAARELNKEVEVDIDCGSIEMDRRILEDLKDPIIHLIRNSVDHGIEPVSERETKGKNRRGQIRIALEVKGGQLVELTISDDGAGMDPEVIRQTAIEKGLIDAVHAESLGDQAALMLIFLSGFSTSPIITDLSGRGLGMAIVREKVEKLGGQIQLVNKKGHGVSFHIRLPTTRATFRGVLVRMREEIYVFPTICVERVIGVRKSDIQSVEGQESIKLDGRIISLVSLGDILKVEDGKLGNDQERFPAVVVSVHGQTLAFIVNEVINEQEVLVKSMGPQMQRVRFFEGVTVLDGGRLAPILHLHDLIHAAGKVVRSGCFVSQPSGQAKDVRKKILVVEDSITSRTLLKNILEAARYEVQTAVDGVDGLTRLRNGNFDLVVSDVEMPRLHGFDLTARIRADKALSQIPVILVTARESREDREKGIEVGANAYIVKSSFDQSNLLDVIQRII